MLPSTLSPREGCPFCTIRVARLLHDDHLTAILWDAHPVSPGHALVVTKRHVASWFEASGEERAELLRGIELARDLVLRAGHAPDAFNIGVNVGTAAGQTVDHLHVHLIPRYHGDVDDPRGGVRHVIPARANYLALAPATTPTPSSSPPITGSLTRGFTDPLLPKLLRDLDHADHADIAVAFTLRSGLDHLEPHLRDLLRKPQARLRFLTGDYLDVTDPVALRRLVDLAHDPAHAARAELRVFETARARMSFHPKAYLFHGGESPVAYVGSSNLSHRALLEGVEWNYRVATDAAVRDVCVAFEQLFHHEATCALDASWIDAYETRRTAPERKHVLVDADDEAEPPPEAPPPHGIQLEALAALAQTREGGARAGLVVLATGLGKTWLSAFDSLPFERVLFVAHREEILAQAMATYRRIRPTAHLGWFTGKEKEDDATVLFASIQTLGRARHLERFEPRVFDYIVIDEFHHASAKTYRDLINHFEPAFLLGLTATPERTDGGDLLALCQQNLVYRADLLRGIEEHLLSPFRYFGVPDEVDYDQIPWRSTRFDEHALTEAVATVRRADNALEQFRKHRGKRALGFCVSQRHADFMATHFRNAGVRAVAVHAGPTSAPRAASLEQLAADPNEVDIVFAVDMFNEGVDVPTVDTVLMLRPTESRIVWLQQFGRGLRTAEGKDHLTVVDYIGNHRTFLMKPQALLGLGPAHVEIRQALEALQAGRFALPPGCEVTYDLEAVDIIEKLLRIPKRDSEALTTWYELFRERRGERPRAVEAFEERYNPRSAHKAHGSWLELVQHMGDLDDADRAAMKAAGGFLVALERTPMSRSYKMVLLRAMLSEDAFPGAIDIGALTAAFARVARRSPVLRVDVSVSVDEGEDLGALRKLIEENPVAAWVGGKGTGDQPFFTHDAATGRFATKFNATGDVRTALQELTREIVDWRLAEYLDHRRSDLADRPVLKVIHAGKKPIVKLDRNRYPDLPRDWTPLLIDGQSYFGNFVKEYLNVVSKDPDGQNELPGILRRWFGADAGAPGTRYMVACDGGPDGRYTLSPLDRRSPTAEP